MTAIDIDAFDALPFEGPHTRRPTANVGRPFTNKKLAWWGASHGARGRKPRAKA
jgi:hypothetical protein